MTENTTQTSAQEKEELDEILKSTLDDFDKCPSSSAPATEEAAKPEPAAKSFDKLEENFEEKFKELFLNDVDEATFSTKMTDFLSDYQKQYDTQAKAEPSKAADENADVVSEAVRSLVENIEEIKETADWQMGGAGAFDFNDGKSENAFSFMEQMFEMLMSKEVLYPSLVAVKDQYPAWLQENKEKVSEEEYSRYSKQFHVVKKICAIFENENESDPESVKQKRFTELVGLLQEMTELGQPPKDFSGVLPSTTMSSDLFNTLQADMEPNNCNPM